MGGRRRDWVGGEGEEGSGHGVVRGETSQHNQTRHPSPVPYTPSKTLPSLALPSTSPQTLPLPPLPSTSPHKPSHPMLIPLPPLTYPATPRSSLYLPSHSSPDLTPLTTLVSPSSS
ncbi:hypothetical protein E2C01_095711 [Portunus trituberculatus]|uniref:Uncharacterized protein n=1 Tax=Portunus trituberculatus TaxID=210409 RepID=A0A5B7JTQ6_PORTR|nr:hypothetical protein [Portunus trituberculatus]